MLFRSASSLGAPFTVTGLAFVLTVATTVHTAVGLSIREDKDESLYAAQAATAPFDGAGRFDTANQSGALIAPNWVLGAAHPGGAATFETPDGSTANVKQRIAFPNWNALDKDFALFELETPITTATVVGLYQGALATLAGETAVYAGSGFTGDGNQGQTGPRKLLAGTNYISLVIGNSVRSDFDDPEAPTGPLTELETALMDKDSGGGLYIESGGSYLLAGVHTAVDVPDGQSIGQYGQTNISTALTDDVRDWITRTIPEPGSLCVLLGGGAVLLLRRRRA